ncbi:MAG: methyl-accepting chemotaxis protein, partial [Pseudothermotoga sp.]
NLISNIGEPAQRYGDAAKNVTELENRARRITKTVNTIDRVTIQTNMLAVNGFIEAARAGEYGKGFAVVANDIRNLANESGSNAEQIKDLVSNMQYLVATVSADINESVRTSIGEVNRAKETTKLIGQARQSLEQLLSAFENVNKEIDQIASAIEETNKAIEQINAAAQESASAIEEASKGASEQAKGVEELAKAIEEISAIADELQSEAGV